MSYIERAFTVGAYTVEIVQDDDAQSPAEWADKDGAFAVSAMRSYWTPGNPLGVRTTDLPETREDFEEEHAAEYWTFPVRAYVHSGVSLSLGSAGQFGCMFDSGFAGWVLVARSSWPDAEAAERAAESVVNEWNDYLSGNVYGFVVRDADGDTVDSCYGYTGDPDTSGVVADARASAEAWAQGDADYARNERAAGNDPADTTTRPADGDSAGPDADE
jgi:hypothetical protein